MVNTTKQCGSWAMNFFFLYLKIKTFQHISNVNEIMQHLNTYAPVGTRGLKSRLCPPYPHACRKRRLKWGRYIAQVADTALSTYLTLPEYICKHIANYFRSTTKLSYFEGKHTFRDLVDFTEVLLFGALADTFDFFTLVCWFSLGFTGVSDFFGTSGVESG